MNSEIQIFESKQFGQLRTMVAENGEPWFMGKDVATLLCYKDKQKAIKMHVDEEDKLTRQIVVSGQGRNITIINESGLYSLSDHGHSRSLLVNDLNFLSSGKN